MDQFSRVVYKDPHILGGVLPITENSTIWIHGEEIEKLKNDYIALNLRVLQLESFIKSLTGISININDLNSSTYSLKKPISLIINKENSYFISEVADFDIHGIGETEKESIDSFKSALISYFESLIDPKSKLSNALKSKLKLLKKFIHNENKKV